jgi:hypothetical protein
MDLCGIREPCVNERPEILRRLRLASFLRCHNRHSNRVVPVWLTERCEHLVQSVKVLCKLRQSASFFVCQPSEEVAPLGFGRFAPTKRTIVNAQARLPALTGPVNEVVFVHLRVEPDWRVWVPGLILKVATFALSYSFA